MELKTLGLLSASIEFPSNVSPPDLAEVVDVPPRWKNREVKKRTVFRPGNDVPHLGEIGLDDSSSVSRSSATTRRSRISSGSQKAFASLNFFLFRVVGPLDAGDDLSTQNAGNAETTERELHSRLSPTSAETFSCLLHSRRDKVYLNSIHCAGGGCPLTHIPASIRQQLDSNGNWNWSRYMVKMWTTMNAIPKFLTDPGEVGVE